MAQMEALQKESDGLFGYYDEVMGQEVGLDVNHCCNSINFVVAAMMEGIELPLSQI